jgi:hypothetical protein
LVIITGTSPGFFVRFVRRVDQLHAVAVIEVAGLLVVDVGQERQVRIRVHRRRTGFGFTAAARVRGDPGSGQVSITSRRNALSCELGMKNACGASSLMSVA